MELEVEGPVMVAAILDALEACNPVLRDNIRDYATKQRRDFVRHLACAEDLSLDPPDAPLPSPIAEAVSGGRRVGGG